MKTPKLVRLRQVDTRHCDQFILFVWDMHPANENVFAAALEEYGFVCALCGETANKHEVASTHIRNDHSEWFNAIWVVVKQVPASQEEENRFSIKSWFERNLSMLSRKCLEEDPSMLGCDNCEHSVLNRAGVFCKIKNRYISRTPAEKEPDYDPEYDLKPWKDPESLFCSPKLGEIIGKEPASGEECGD